MKLKITYKPSEDQTTFGDLHAGDVFRFSSHTYMKTPKIIIPGNSEINSINLVGGTPIKFYDRDYVYKMDAELIIKDA